MKTKTKKNIARISFLLFIICLAFFFVKVCTRSERKYVYFGEDGYTQYTVVGNDSINFILYNNGCNPYYIATITFVRASNRSFFEEVFPFLQHDSCVFNEIQVNPGDTVILKKHERIAERWKYVDECGHLIPFGDIRHVGYWEDGEFNEY